MWFKCGFAMHMHATLWLAVYFLFIEWLLLWNRLLWLFHWFVTYFLSLSLSLALFVCEWLCLPLNAENQFHVVEYFLLLSAHNILPKNEWVNGISSAHELKIISAYCCLCATRLWFNVFFCTPRNMRFSYRCFFLRLVCIPFCLSQQTAASDKWCFMLTFLTMQRIYPDLSRVNCTHGNNMQKWIKKFANTIIQSPTFPNRQWKKHKTLIYMRKANHFVKGYCLTQGRALNSFFFEPALVKYPISIFD